MTGDDFDGLFNSFTSTVQRLEGLPEYRVGGAEAERIAARREGRPRPERSVATDPWLARIALTTLVDGKVWERYRVVDDPLTDYQDMQIRESHRESQAAGERVWVARRSDVGDSGPDVWLFDSGLRTQRAALMHYGPTGEYEGAELITDPEILAGYQDAIARIHARAIRLNEFLAELVRA